MKKGLKIATILTIIIILVGIMYSKSIKKQGNTLNNFKHSENIEKEEYYRVKKENEKIKNSNELDSREVSNEEKEILKEEMNQIELEIKEIMQK